MSIAEVAGISDIEPLVVLKIESGTEIRINLKGAGGPIKELKKLIMEF